MSKMFREKISEMVSPLSISFLFLVLGFAVSCGSGMSGNTGGPTDHVDTKRPVPPGMCPLVVKDKDKPWLAGLDPTAISAINPYVEKGVLLVQYDGCGGYSPLEGCVLSDYSYEPYEESSPMPKEISINSKDDLSSNLPIFFMRHRSKYTGTSTWSFDYLVTGTLTAFDVKVDRSKLSPRCAEATHYVRQITLGAYRLGERKSSGESSGFSGLGTEATTNSEQSEQLRTRDGEYEKCMLNPSDKSDCRAKMRFHLEPIDNQPGTGYMPAPGQAGPPAPWNPEATSGPSVSWGWINVTSNYTGIPVMIDGVDRGKTPLKEWKESVGNHNITVSNRCVHPGNQTVHVKSGETSDVRIELIPKEGALRLLTVDDNGKPVRASVYIGEKKVGDTDGSLRATTFKRNICDNGKGLEVRASGYVGAKKKITIKERGYTNLTLEMKREKVATAPSTASSSRGTTGVKWVSSRPAGVQFTKTEVTVDQYRACVLAGACSSKGVTMPYWSNKEQPKSAKYCNYDKGDRGAHPMNCIDWSMAKSVCSWLGGRLPTEDEWYAEASNGGDRDWPWGDSPNVNCSYAIWGDGKNTDGCGKDRTWPVCSKIRGNSVSGLCDMSGNVWEWTSDLYDSEHDSRVVRGGSWLNDNPDALRASYRGGSNPSFRNLSYGVRCVRSSH